MSLLTIGEIRKFKYENPVSSLTTLTGVVVEVNELYKTYSVVDISGGYYIVNFGNVIGTAKVSKEQRVIMLELAKAYIKLQFIEDEKKRLMNQGYEVQGNIDTLIHKLKLQYSPEKR